MPRFGISLFLISIFFQCTVREMSAIALDHEKWNDPARNGSFLADEESIHLITGNEKLNHVNKSIINETSAGTTIKKCCPWGSVFDVNILICKKVNVSTPVGFFRGGGHTKFYLFSVGTPKCVDTVLSSIVTNNMDYDNEVFPEDYCVDESDDFTVMVTCGDPSVICESRPCIRKCKPLGEFYDESNNGSEVAFTPVFYNLSTLKPDESVSISQFGLFFGMDCEGGKIRLDNGTSDINYIGTNGSLFAPGHKANQVFLQYEYCIEYVHDEGIFTFLCPPMYIAEEEITESVESYILLALGFIASCICLLATFIVYLCSRKSKTLYGKTFMFYVGCLCIAYLSLAIVHLGNHFLMKATCILLGYSILFSFLAAFFWLNIMSIDIWKSFRYLRAAEWRRAPDNRSRLVAYSVYAWGMPVGITAICGLLDAMPRSNSSFNMDIIRPDIGSSSCWFSRSTYGIYVFFVVPVSLIITCNMILYVNTVWRCWKVKAEINKLDLQCRSRGKYSVHRDQLLLNGKLFIVMGVSWGPEFISTILPHPLWKITDAVNTLLGVFIFVIFVLKKKTVSKLTNRVRDSLRSMSKKSSNLDYLNDMKACISSGDKNNLVGTSKV